MKPSVRSACLAVAVAGLAACESPTSHREPVTQFAEAVREIDSYTRARAEATVEIRTELAREIIAAESPIVGVTPACSDALRRLNKRQDTAEPPREMAQGARRDAANGASAALREDIRNCQITLEGAEAAESLLDSTPLQASQKFTQALEAYAGALEAVTTAASRESFTASVNKLGTAAVSLAHSSAEAAGKDPRETPDIGPFATLIGNAAYYYLEDRRAAALHDAAEKAQTWIDSGAGGVAGALEAYHTERLNALHATLQDTLEAVNVADGAAYLEGIDATVAAHAELVGAMRADPAAPLRKLPEAHGRLIASLENPERFLQPTISAARDLYQSARDARAALDDET